MSKPIPGHKRLIFTYDHVNRRYICSNVNTTMTPADFMTAYGFYLPEHLQFGRYYNPENNITVVFRIFGRFIYLDFYNFKYEETSPLGD